MGQEMKARTKVTKTTRPKAEKRTTDPFAVFKQAAIDAFNFLIENYDFEQLSSSVHPPECAIKYQNQTTGVTITYEWGGALWVDLSRISDQEKYSVDILMLECQPERSIADFHPSESESPNEYVKRVLQKYAQVLKSCGRDILIGDFRIFPKLKNLSEEVLRQRNAEMFKT